MHNRTRLIISASLVAGAIATLSLRAPHYAQATIDVGAFHEGALVEPPEIVACTLENGTSASCVKLVVKYLPDELEIGPFCPATIDATGGLWDWDGPSAGLYRIDGTFLRMLDGLGYTFYGADGRVHIADPATGRPGVEHACLEATLDTTVTMTILLPRTPVMARNPTSLGTVSKVGLALDGVPIFSDAPSVLHTGHMPALDPCGGHVDPGGWYHWHATSTDVDTALAHEHVEADCSQPQAPSGLFGLAFDGVPLYGSADVDGAVPTDLDACNGHVAPTREDAAGSYHYHAALTFPNLPTCLSGVQARNNFVTTSRAGIGSQRGPGGPPGAGPPGRGPSAGAPGGGHGAGRGGPGGGPPPGFAEAARQLGVSEQALMKVVQEHGGRMLDFAGAARALGVSESALRAALPPPPPRPWR